MSEQVILVDEQNNILGYMPKSEVHSLQTPLHRAFSCFIFNSKGEILLQQRSGKKKTWPLVWSNSVCGHPLPDETNVAAVLRRADFELGLQLDKCQMMSPYRYRFTRFGVTENEICPVFIAFSDQTPNFNDEEVESVQYKKWSDWLQELQNDKKGEEGVWSEWCKEEVELLKQKFAEIKEMSKEQIKQLYPNLSDEFIKVILMLYV
jgi:isopentenyl-diphosphate Delta-isomerase